MDEDNDYGGEFSYGDRDFNDTDIVVVESNED